MLQEKQREGWLQEQQRQEQQELEELSRGRMQAARAEEER